MDGVPAHDEDFYRWSQDQAAALRRLAARRDLPNELDLENVAEEIEDLGRSELRTVESFAELLLRHLLKLGSAPSAPAAEHWRQEIEVQHAALRADLRNSMRHLIDLDRSWKAARARAGALLAERGDVLMLGLPQRCPLSLEELVDEPFDLEKMLNRIRQAATTTRD